MQRPTRSPRNLELVLPRPAAAPWCGPWLVVGAGVLVAIALILGW